MVAALAGREGQCWGERLMHNFLKGSLLLHTSAGMVQHRGAAL